MSWKNDSFSYLPLEGLYNGAYYEGKQSTNTGFFRIDMKINNVEINQSFICGVFKIYNLTRSYDLLTTYFEGELIGTHYSFAERPDELEQWKKFPSFSELYVDIPSSYNLRTNNYLYFRIKELFLLPDPLVTTIPGASIDGFYYCCYDKTKDSFNGFYHYANSIVYSSQKIVLNKTPRRIYQVYDFR